MAAGPPVGPGVDADPLLAQQWHLRNTGQTAYADVGQFTAGDTFGFWAAEMNGPELLGSAASLTESGETSVVVANATANNPMWLVFQSTSPLQLCVSNNGQPSPTGTYPAASPVAAVLLCAIATPVVP